MDVNWKMVCKTCLSGCLMFVGGVSSASLEDDYVRCVSNMTRQSANELISLCDAVLQGGTNQEMKAFAKIAMSISKCHLASEECNLYLEREAFSLCEDVVTNGLLCESSWPRQLATFVHMSDCSSAGKDEELVAFATNSIGVANGTAAIPAPVWEATLCHAGFGSATFRQAFDFWHAVGMLGLSKTNDVSALTNGLPAKLEGYVKRLAE